MRKCFNCGGEASYYSLDGLWSCDKCREAGQVSGGAFGFVLVLILASVFAMLYFSIRIPFDKYPASRW